MWIRKDGFAQLINLEKMKDKPESRDPLNLKLPVVHTKIRSTRYIPREQFKKILKLIGGGGPSYQFYQFCTWILQKVSYLNLTSGRSARPPRPS